MEKITTELEYYNALIEILEKIYDCSNESNEKITGIKNKEQPYELKIKDILDEYSNESNESNESNKSEIKCKYTNLFYEYQPNGSQQPPDYMIFCENYEKIKIECKSSKTNKPVWNCSIPEKNTIYVFLDTKNKKTYIFDGEDIIESKDRLEIIKFNDELKKLCAKFNETILSDKNMSYYPRQMINQTKKMDEIIIDRNKTFNKIKNDLLSRATNKIENKIEPNLPIKKENKENKDNKDKKVKEKVNKSTKIKS